MAAKLKSKRAHGKIARGILARCVRRLVTEKELKKHFKAFNVGFFDRKIPPDITVNYEDLSKHRCVGIWRPRKREIAIEELLTYTSESYVFITLLHEMAHAYLESADGYIGYSGDKGHGTRWQGEICRLWKAGAFDGLL